MSDVFKTFSTTVRSNALVAKNFSFLPPHGRYMQPDEEYTFAGSLPTLLAGVENRRRRAAFIAAVESGIIQVLETPMVQARDSVTGLTYGIGVANGNVVIHSPEGSSVGPGSGN